MSLSPYFKIDKSLDYYSDDLILYRNYKEENEIYCYNVSKGDLAMSPFLIGKQKLIKYQFGVINIAGTYIRIGTNNKHDRLEFQCLDPRKDEWMDTHGMKNIDWDNFKIKFSKLANSFICRYADDRCYVFANHNREKVYN